MLATLPCAASSSAPAPTRTTRTIVLPRATDRLVFRGAWRADVSLGAPEAIVVAAPGIVRVERHATRVEFLQTRPLAANRIADVRVHVPVLRGLATSGRVALHLRDPRGVALFLDLSQATSATVTGSVPSLRITTSGVARIDACGLKARVARVHARQASTLCVRAGDGLTIVAADTSHVTYRGTERAILERRGSATVEPGADAAAGNASR